MTWQVSDGIVQVRPLGRWLYVTWMEQSKQSFFHFVKSIKKLEKAALQYGARGLVLDTTVDNVHVQDMLRRGGAEQYLEKDGIVYFKKEVTRHVNGRI
jgi:hypothetical protein